ncbi:hypothetical protein T4B_14502 [Trichinella pseudospiralis]|uniref:Uncharacterized protein n=1 Tax=Trichinella pseudospiralis TaxID=6337 RepID=A0A0V1JG48_TRIPS|nr:hypothetical protein T4B_14502 [Trichinella pseudospiralis]
MIFKMLVIYKMLLGSEIEYKRMEFIISFYIDGWHLTSRMMPGVKLVQARLRTKPTPPSQRHCVHDLCSVLLLHRLDCMFHFLTLDKMEKGVVKCLSTCDIETMLTRRVCRRVNSENRCRGGLFLIVDRNEVSSSNGKS